MTYSVDLGAPSSATRMDRKKVIWGSKEFDKLMRRGYKIEAQYQKEVIMTKKVIDYFY